MDPITRLSKLPQSVRRDLLRFLTAEANERTDVLRRFSERGDHELVGLLDDVENDEALRERVIGVVRHSLDDGGAR